jgi:hypothetical protein
MTLYRKLLVSCGMTWRKVLTSVHNIFEIVKTPSNILMVRSLQFFFSLGLWLRLLCLNKIYHIMFPTINSSILYPQSYLIITIIRYLCPSKHPPHRPTCTFNWQNLFNSSNKWTLNLSTYTRNCMYMNYNLFLICFFFMNVKRKRISHFILIASIKR